MVPLIRGILLLFVLLARESESQAPTILTAPDNPTRVVEGDRLTLEWTYNVGGAPFREVSFRTTGVSFIVDKFRSDPIRTRSEYVGRITANLTDSFSSITFLAVNSSTDNKLYELVVENNDGADAISPVELIVQIPASLTFRAPDQVLVEGDPASFSLFCNASGKPTPTITWTKVLNNGSDSEVLFEAPSSPYVLSNNRSNEGTYRCTANNGVGSPVNHTVSVTVNFKPENVQLNVQSKDANICRGESVNFTCSASGKPPVHSYQLFVNDSLVSGDSSAGFWSQNMSTEGVFIYRCEANNSVGRTNTSRTVPVSVPSVITSALNNITLVEGESRTLSCAVSGLPPPSVSWTEPRTGSRSPGNILQLTNITRNDAGEYICESSNVCGNDTKSLFLTVYFPPSLTARAADQVLVEGDPATFSLSCSASGEPTPNITWTKVVKNGNDSEVLFHETPSSPFVLSNDRSNEGRYRCTANNGIGSPVNHTVNVTVNFKPENVQLNVQSNDANICRGESVNFTCSASGKPPVHSYQLFANNSLVSGDSNAGFWSQTLSTEGVFIYRCEANNTVGRTNTTRTVPVNGILPLDNITIAENDDRNLTCVVTGIPVPSVSWTEVRTGTQSPGNILQLTNISRNDAGEYICESSNVCGNDTKSLFLTVHFPPENIQLSASETTVCNGSMITLDCSADANPMVHTYQLYQNGIMVNESSSSGVWNITLSQGGTFNYTCVANNTVGTLESALVSVSVNVPSSIQAIPKQTIIELENLTVTCEASGIPAPSVSWVKVGSNERTNRNELVLTNISRSQAGVYRCEATNPCGNASESVTVDVQFPPENVQLSVREPRICRGSVITFNCSAYAVPMVNNYQLYENGSPVNQSNSSGVWSRTMSSAGVFVYQCMVANLIGQANSTVLTVTVNVPSSIDAIENKTLNEGDGLNLTCQASGMPSPSVSWVRVSDGQLTNSNELVFTNINRSEAGEYRCEASNECGNASESAVIVVQFRPENVQLSVGETTICLGTVITFNCSAYAVPMVNDYKLYENGSLVNQSNSSGVWSRTMSAAGVFVYQCMVANSIGPANSTVLTVTVNVRSSIDAVENKTLIEGNSSTLTCRASGIPPPSVSWIRVSDGQRTNSNELVFTNITRSKAGQYRCEASNECGNASESAVVVVNYPPEITNISGPQTTNNGDTLTLNCTADGNPAPTITWTKLPDDSVTMPLMITKQSEGRYRCTAHNGIGSAVTSETSIVVQFPATISPLKGKVVNKGENVSLFCNASGEPTPSVMWTHVNRNLKHNNATWVITDINVNKLGEYRCDASNDYGNDSESVTILFPGGKCEQVCTKGKRCRLFKMYLCFCDVGKKGPDCSVTEPLAEQIPVGIKINEEFKDEYEDLNNPETKKLVARIEQGCRTELAGTGLTNVRVTGLRKGSVIADVELTFNRSVSQDNIDTLLREATKDKKLGDIEVSEVLVGGKIPGPEETTKECNALFEGPDCKKAKPALIVICVIAGVIVLALLVAIVACSMHKKKSSGQTSFQNGSYAQRQDPEGNGTMDKGFDGNGGRIPRAHVNTAYQNDREEPTPMVTFNSNPAHTPGITLNDSSQTQKAQPGEGTYADLGQFHQKPATPTATAPAKRPPAYEETPYAEITQFLKGPVETDEVSPQEKEEEAPHETAGKEEAADGSLNEAVNEAVNEAQPDNLYPRLDADGGNDQQTEFVVAI